VIQSFVVKGMLDSDMRDHPVRERLPTAAAGRNPGSAAALGGTLGVKQRGLDVHRARESRPSACESANGLLR